MRHLVLVLSEAVEGQEAAFDEWYENVHLDEVLASAGWASAQRFALSDAQGVPCRLPHLAIYEVEADDPKAILAHLNATRGERQQSAAFRRETASAWVFTPLGPRHEAD